MADLPTKEELNQLPPRFLVAYAVRCAQRVQPLYRLPDDHPHLKKHVTAVDAGDQAHNSDDDSPMAGIGEKRLEEIANCLQSHGLSLADG